MSEAVARYLNARKWNLEAARNAGGPSRSLSAFNAVWDAWQALTEAEQDAADEIWDEHMREAG